MLNGVYVKQHGGLMTHVHLFREKGERGKEQCLWQLKKSTDLQTRLQQAAVVEVEIRAPTAWTVRAPGQALTWICRGLLLRV